MLALVRWHRFALLLALTGCASAQTCTLVGCVSQLTVRLPAGVTSAQACVADVCTGEVVGGALRVPLSRRGDTSAAAVTVTVDGRSYDGVVPLTRTRPNGEKCPPDCINGDARLDLDGGRVLPGRG